MSWLLILGLKNALLALPVAAFALAVGRLCKRPALAHLLWALVVVKLITPPLIDVPVGWRLDVESWVGAQANTGASVGAEAPREVAIAARAEPRNAADSPDRSVASQVTHLRTRQVARTSGDVRHEAYSSATGPAPAAAWSRWFGWTTSLQAWLRLAGAVWILGSLGTLSMMLFCGWRFRRFVRGAAQRDHKLAARVGELAAQTGLGVPPRVVVVDGVVSPMLWGLGHSVRIVFPVKLAERLHPTALDSLLLHELAHYARGDQWVRALELTALVLYWWNPVLWLALRRIEAAEEECCDAWVVQRQSGARRAYAEALLTTIDFLCDPPLSLPPAASGLGEASLLRGRLTQIMRGDVSARLSRKVRVLVLAPGAIVSPLEPALKATALPRTRLSSLMRTEASDRQADRELRMTSPPAQIAPPASTLPVSIQKIPPAPSLRPVPAALWASANSPDGQFRLEARAGRKIALLGLETQYRVDLSAYGISCAAFAPASETFATGHADAVVRVWDSGCGGVLQPLYGAQAPIASVQFSPDGRQLAAGAEDGTLLIWDLPTWELATRIEGSAPIACLRWSPRGDRLAIAFGAWNDKDRASLVIWSRAGNAVAFVTSLPEPPGALDWLEGSQSLLVASWNGQAQAWNLATGEPGGSVQLDKDRVSAAAWSPNCPLAMPWMISASSAVEMQP